MDGSVVFARWRQCGHIGATWRMRLNLCFLRLTRVHNPKGVSIGSAVFTQITAECPDTLQWDAPFPSKLLLLMGGSGHPSNKWFPGLTRVLNKNGVSIGSAGFAGLTTVTDRQTDRPRYFVGNNRRHLCTQYYDAA